MQKTGFDNLQVDFAGLVDGPKLIALLCGSGGEPGKARVLVPAVAVKPQRVAVGLGEVGGPCQHGVAKCPIGNRDGVHHHFIDGARVELDIAMLLQFSQQPKEARGVPIFR